MNKDILQGKWEQIKGQIQKTFGQLTDDELAQIQGDTKRLKGILQENYGKSKEEAEKMYNELFSVENMEEELNNDLKEKARTEEDLLREEADKLQDKGFYEETAEATAFIREDNQLK